MSSTEFHIIIIIIIIIIIKINLDQAPFYSSIVLRLMRHTNIFDFATE